MKGPVCGGRVSREPLKPVLRFQQHLFSACRALREWERGDAQKSRPLRSPNNSGACDGSQSVRTHGSVTWPIPTPTATPGLGLPLASPTHRVRTHRRRERRGAPDAWEKSPPPLGFAWVGGDRRVEGRHPARPACGVGEGVGYSSFSSSREGGTDLDLSLCPGIWAHTPHQVPERAQM